MHKRVARWRRSFGFLLLCLGASMSMTAAAQNTLLGELGAMRSLREDGLASDASDRAAGRGMRDALADTADIALQDVALWEVADVHLMAANDFRPGSTNIFARRAVDAWQQYVEFSIAHQRDKRIHQAVEYLQRSYIQYAAFEEMFAALASIPHEYVNNHVITRWEDRLRACPAFASTRSQPWRDEVCSDERCKAAVSGFRDYVNVWLTAFNLRAEMRLVFDRRVAAIPRSCTPSPD